MQNLISLLLTTIGFVIGLGAVTVIDLHGFLAQKSKYWTRATIQSHKITKPLIWIGIILVSLGIAINFDFYTFRVFQVALIVLLILNGIFLSFYVSPLLLKKERNNQADEILEKSLQNKIFISFIFSVFGWWASLFIFVYTIWTYLPL